MRAVVVKPVRALASDRLVLVGEASVPVELAKVTRIEHRGHGHGSVHVHLEGARVLEMHPDTLVLVAGEHVAPR